MTASKLAIIISNEYTSEITSRSFWISTLIVPVVYLGFILLLGYLMNGSVMTELSMPGVTESIVDSDPRLVSLVAGILLSLFLMIYGAQIYSKVRKEKVNRIIEVLATSVTGRTLMLAKIISVMLTAFTQIGIWLLFGCIGLASFFTIEYTSALLYLLFTPAFYTGLLWTSIFFIGGYLFYGSMYAACGAMTDKDNENHGYMTLITMLLLAGFYIEQYAVEHPGMLIVRICGFIPFTAPGVATVGALSGDSTLLITVIRAAVLYIFAFIAVILSGKVYTSSLLLNGKKFSPADIFVFP